MKKIALLGVCCAAIAAAGCLGFERKSTVTGPSGANPLVGSWSSAAAGLPSPASCSDFRWNVTEQTGASASGTFSATCAGNVRLAGTARGTLTGSLVNWTADGTATAADALSCRFTLGGTAELGTNAIHVPYAGEFCGVRVSGEETLRR
jgi:hypothetical protein